jgi:hypothetical protein
MYLQRYGSGFVTPYRSFWIDSYRRLNVIACNVICVDDHLQCIYVAGLGELVSIDLLVLLDEEGSL